MVSQLCIFAARYGSTVHQSIPLLSRKLWMSVPSAYMEETVLREPMISCPRTRVTMAITGISVMMCLRPCSSLHASTGVKATSYSNGRACYLHPTRKRQTWTLCKEGITFTSRSLVQKPKTCMPSTWVEYPPRFPEPVTMAGFRRSASAKSLAVPVILLHISTDVADLPPRSIIVNRTQEGNDHHDSQVRGSFGGLAVHERLDSATSSGSSWMLVP